MSRVNREADPLESPTDGRPWVTAIVTTYNSSEFLEQTLSSLAEQTWSNLEILIGDDCSDDETVSIAEKFCASRDNCRVIARRENLGWIENTNDLMARAEGSFMFLAFHDDVVDPRYVEKLMERLEARPGAVLAFSDVEVIEPDGRRYDWRFTALDGVRSGVGLALIMGRRPALWWVPIHGVFRADLFRATGGLHKNAAGELGADWPFLLHAAMLGELVRVPEALCVKHFKSQSLSRGWRPSRSELRSWKLAGVKEVWASSVPLWKKLVVVPYLATFLLTPAWLAGAFVRVARVRRRRSVSLER